jgi:SAM-dependent methyltransferase
MQLNEWQKGIGFEVWWWREWVKNNGGEHHTDYANRIDPNYPFQDYLIPLLPANEAIKVLDVGAGPITNLGKHLSGKNLTIVPIDPLAESYATIFKEFNVTPLIKTEFGEVENLVSQFGENAFDLVYMCNALDHSRDPMQGISQMLAVTKPGCYVSLHHFIREAEHASYGGFHQFNLDTDNGKFILWNRSERFDVEDLLKDVGEFSVEVRPNTRWIIVNIKKC